VLSNNWSGLRRAIEEEWQIAGAFDELFISAEIGLVKPDPRLYRLALDRLGVAPGEAVFIDDFPENVQAARQAGLHAIHFTSPDQARQELQDLLNRHGSDPALHS
jgi:epoxide hydrolase-like predicted phosphatase